MHFTNKDNCSLPVAVWLLSSEYSKGNIKHPFIISATELLKSVRQFILVRRLKEQNVEMEMDMLGLFASRLGHAIHDSMEKAWLSPDLPNVLKKLGYSDKTIEKIRINPTTVEPNTTPIYLEQRVHKEFNGWLITGQYDAVFNGELTDNKSTSTFTYEKGNKNQDYILQGSIYKWLNPDIITSPVLNIQYFFKDWSKAKSLNSSTYPTSPVLQVKLPLLDLTETEKFILDKLHAINENLTVDEPDLPPCSDKELWMGDPEYKVYKDQDTYMAGSRAIKAGFKSVSDAVDFVNANSSKYPNAVIRELKGEPKACQYCMAASCCSQFIEMSVKL